MDYEEVEKLSLEESKRQTKERKESGLNMIRQFTFEEKKLLWDGLREDKKDRHLESFSDDLRNSIIKKVKEKNDQRSINKKLEGDIAVAEADLRTFLASPIGVAEHIDYVLTAEKKTEVLAHAKDKLEAIRNL